MVRVLLGGFLVGLLAIGAVGAPVVPMPDLSVYPYTQELIGRCAGIPVDIKRVNYDSEESRDGPFYIASAWFLLDEGIRRERPFAVGLYESATGGTFYLDFDRDGIAEEVLTVAQLVGKYVDVCAVAERVIR